MTTGDSYIFRAIASFLFFVINVFAVYLLLRGHNFPGGGFIGGLGSALSLIMLSLAFGVQRTRNIVRVDPTRVAIVGLVVAVGTALLPVVVGDALLQQYNWKFENVPVLGTFHVGTPLLFDAGVFLVVVGVSTKLISVLLRAHSGLTALEPREWRRYAARLEEPLENYRRGVKTPPAEKEDPS